MYTGSSILALFRPPLVLKRFGRLRPSCCICFLQKCQCIKKRITFLLDGKRSRGVWKEICFNHMDFVGEWNSCSTSHRRAIDSVCEKTVSRITGREGRERCVTFLELAWPLFLCIHVIFILFNTRRAKGKERRLWYLVHSAAWKGNHTHVHECSLHWTLYVGRGFCSGWKEVHDMYSVLTGTFVTAIHAVVRCPGREWLSGGLWKTDQLESCDNKKGWVNEKGFDQMNTNAYPLCSLAKARVQSTGLAIRCPRHIKASSMIIQTTIWPMGGKAVMIRFIVMVRSSAFWFEPGYWCVQCLISWVAVVHRGFSWCEEKMAKGKRMRSQ